MDKTTFFDMTYGMFCVSSLDGNKPVGCIANSIIQITSEPAKMALSLNKDNYTSRCIEKTGMVSVSILSEETSGDVIGVFGFKTSKDCNKFENIDFEYVSGMPVIKENICGYFICGVGEIIDCGTHNIYILTVEDAQRETKIKPPMSYMYYHKVIKGKAPKNAPTYAAPEAEKVEKKMICDVCGYIYEGDAEEFDALETYKCPVCGVDKSHFKLS